MPKRNGMQTYGHTINGKGIFSEMPQNTVHSIVVLLI